MVLKRKRNLKIDANTNYSVFFLKDLVLENVEDYVENRDTGMEADEEKEIHLQNIIKGSEKSIPLPVIVEVENVSRSFYTKKQLHKYINWKNDCPNEYIENEEDKIIETEIMNELALGKDLGKSTGKEANSNFNSPNTLKHNCQVSDELSLDKIDVDKLNGEQSTNESNQIAFGKIGKYQNVITADTSADALGNTLKSDHLSHSDSHDKDLKYVDEAHNISLDRRLGMLKINTNSSFYDSNLVVNSTFPRLIPRLCDNKNNISGKSDKILNYCLRRAIVRYEKAGFEPYACFRDRIFHPTFKSRRNETLMIEKITRMRLEFSTLKNLCFLLRDKSFKDLDILKKTHKIIKYSALLNKYKKRRISKMLSESIVRPRYNNKVDLHTIMTDREKIFNLRNIKNNTDLIVDIKFYEEVMKLVTDDSD